MLFQSRNENDKTLNTNYEHGQVNQKLIKFELFPVILTQASHLKGLVLFQNKNFASHYLDKCLDDSHHFCPVLACHSSSLDAQESCLDFLQHI